MSNSTDNLTQAEVERYGRHLVLPQVGEAGQRRLRQGSVLVVGAGGLGSPTLLYLAAAGVGRIGIIDDDVVDSSNLQRQVLFDESEVGQSKSVVAAKKLKQLNHFIEFEAHKTRLSAGNAISFVNQYDVIVDGTDNFSTRYMVNDACVIAGKPNVHGAIFQFSGQVSVFAHNGGPCYRCLFPEVPAADAVPNCAEGGVLGVLAGTIGTLQATEALKILLGTGNTLAGKLLIYDALTPSFETLSFTRNKACPVCGEKPTITSVVEHDIACHRDEPIDEIMAGDLRRMLAAGEQIFLLDVRNPDEFARGHIDGALNIPLATLSERIDDLRRRRNMVVYCQSGGRSQKACQLLLAAGMKAKNLRGGFSVFSSTAQ